VTWLRRILVGFATIAVVLLVQPCAGARAPESPAPGLEPAGQTFLGDSLAISASVWLERRLPAGVDGPPSLLRATAIVRNLLRDTVALSVSGCSLAFRLIDNTGRTVWQSFGSYSRCTQEPRNQQPRVILIPGLAEHVLESAYSAAALGGLNETRYGAAASVHLGNDSVEVDAGTVHVDFGLGSLEYTAHSSVVGEAPSFLETSVTVTNRGSRPVRLEYGSCAVSVHGYNTPDRSGRPAWKSELRQPPPAFVNTVYGCTLELRVRTIMPGDSFGGTELATRAPVHELLADSLPPGRYFLTAAVRLNWHTRELSAGDVMLDTAEAPLPRARSVNGVRYEASFRRSGFPDSLEVVLTIRNERSTAVQFRSSADRTCWLTVSGYDMEVERDRWYLRPWPAWGRRVCTPMAALSIAPHEARELSARVVRPTEPYHYSALVWLDEGLNRSQPVTIAIAEPGG